MASTVVLHVYLAMFAVWSVCSAGWAVSAAHASPSAPYSFQPPKLPKPDFQFTFYMHEQLVLPRNRTAYAVTVPVAKVDEWTLSDQSWLFNIDASFFGSIVVFEDPLTLDPPFNSTQVGFGRGIYVFDKNVGAENSNNGIEYLWTAVFNEESGLGKSTLCFRGWDFFKDSVAGTTEITICGGTGKFRLARGYSRISLVVLDAATGSGALKLDVSVFV